MKKISFKKITAILLIVLLLFVSQVSAAVDPAIISKSSNSLVKLDILRGDGQGNLKLNDKVKRCEFFSLVIRMLGYENNINTDGIEINFKDLSKKHWSYNNMKIALKYELVAGYLDNTVRPDNYVTYAEAQTVLIRALGYESALSGKWPENVINKSTELGVNKYLDMHRDKEITRGEASVLIYNSLTVNFKK
jgi:hypothetical protein